MLQRVERPEQSNLVRLMRLLNSDRDFTSEDFTLLSLLDEVHPSMKAATAEDINRCPVESYLPDQGWDDFCCIC